MGHVLSAREYKLLIRASEFQAKPTLDQINAFWQSRIVALIEEDPEPFDRVVYRAIRFWDTADCVLSKHDLILRTREAMDANFNSGGKFETTLKLRMPDQFVVATSSLTNETAKGDKDVKIETKFEEDIGPYQVTSREAEGTKRVIVAAKRSTRNRFSLSTTVKSAALQPLARLTDVFGLFTEAKGLISEPGTGTDLVGGSLIHEYAFKGAKAKFTDDIDGEFTLSLWCFNGPEAAPDVAELSYSCDLKDGTMPGKAAHGAYDLFINLQKHLADIVDPENNSKTALALPKGCAS